MFDDLARCERGVFLSLYEQTECAVQPSFPALKKVLIYAFDEKESLVSTMEVDNFTPSQENKIFFELPKAGRYSFVVWGGVTDQFFTITPLQKGMSKGVLLLTLKHDRLRAVDLQGVRCYVGTTSEVEVGESDKFFVDVTCNLREFSNRVDVRVLGLKKPENFRIELLSNNVFYAVSGLIMRGIQLFYPADMKLLPNEDDQHSVDLFAHFNTLRLQTGRQNDLIIRNLITDEIVYKADLIGAILLSSHASDINLRCTNDFDVVLKTKVCNCPGGYEVVELWVNDWLVHTYETNLES